MKAKDFTLTDQTGKAHSLHEYLGKWVLVYFYPKDDTSGCTTEACNFRDSMSELQKLGVVILGISKDSIASHVKFAQKYHLNFPILSDESKATIIAYEAWGGLGTKRKSVLIDPSWEIQKVYENVNPTVHASQILDDLKSFQKE